jgi:type IV pilus assembly protein PilA
MKAKNEKKDNKGFSLVELIIVIAIMAILVGIVGTQVIPYINKSKEAKDFQIINSFVLLQQQLILQMQKKQQM